MPKSTRKANADIPKKSRSTPFKNEGKSPVNVAFETPFGASYHGLVEDFLASRAGKSIEGKVDLIFTSPPFPLNRKKRYDNLTGDAYVLWLSNFAEGFKKLLKPKGSIVMEVGNSWVPGKPIMSTLALEALLEFLKRGDLKLCQQLIWHNPARLPSPAQWVNIERIRLKDSYTHLWWMAKDERPKADNRRVLIEYSSAMKELLARKSYNSGKRPSEHNIGKKSFLTNNKGAIPASVLREDCDNNEELDSVVVMANTQATTDYQIYCRNNDIEPHPARMPLRLAEFFIKLLTEEGDLVFDPFSGSNTTGAAAERLNRNWISIEANLGYIEGSKGRFKNINNGKTAFSSR